MMLQITNYSLLMYVAAVQQANRCNCRKVKKGLNRLQLFQGRMFFKCMSLIARSCHGKKKKIVHSASVFFHLQQKYLFSILYLFTRYWMLLCALFLFVLSSWESVSKTSFCFCRRYVNSEKRT